MIKKIERDKKQATFPIGKEQLKEEKRLNKLILENLQKIRINKNNG